MTFPTEYASQLREAAITALLAGATLAEERIERERIDPTFSGDMPRIIVLMDSRGDNGASAGTPPHFTVNGTMILQCLIQEARQDDAVFQLDILIAQALETLFSDPVWAALSQIVSYVVVRDFRDKDNLIIGDARIQISLTWRTYYPPRTSAPPLSRLAFRVPDGTLAIGADATVPPTP